MAIHDTAHAPRGIGLTVALAVLAVVAHLAHLRLIEVKPYAAYEHYQPWRWLLVERPLAAWIVLAQAGIVAAGAWRCRRTLLAIAAVIWRPRTAPLAVVLAGFALAVPTESGARFIGEAILAAGIAVIALLNLVLVAMLMPDRTLAGLASWFDARVTLRFDATATRRWDRYVPVVVAVWVAVIAAIASVVVFERLPHIDDSVSNLFQARYFAAGRLYLPAPPDTPSFQMDQTIVDGARWYGYAFPGWPMVLAVGVLAGVPWLVNPVIGGLTILAGHALIKRRSDRGTANIAVLMLAVSPWLIFMSAELMGHPLSLLLVLVAALAFDRATADADRWGRWAVAAGVAMGALLLTRALDAAILAAAVGVSLLIERRLARALRPAATAAVVAAAAALLMLPYNQTVTGRATYPPHLAWSDSRWGPGVDRMGFGRDIGIPAWPNLDPLPGHGPADVVLNANKNIFMTNVDLFGWATGSLLFLWLAIGRNNWRRSDALILSILCAFIVGYSFYWFSGGPDLGARYWYPLLVPFAALCARGVQMVTAALSDQRALSHAGVRVGMLILLASLGAAVGTIPWRATAKYYRYRGISGEVRALAVTQSFGNALVFVRTAEKQVDYASAFALNPRTLDEPGTVYAFDAGPEHRAAVVSHFRNRPVWVLGRDATDSNGNGPLRVLAGPLEPGTVPQ